MTKKDMVVATEVREGRYALLFNNKQCPNVKLYVDDKLIYDDIPSYIIIKMADMIRTGCEE